jgi:hypothetical protein
MVSDLEDLVATIFQLAGEAMKMKTFSLCAVCFLSCFIFVGSAFTQGTEFTYQGQLSSGTTVATGSFDLTFALFSASNGAMQVGVTLTNTATAVSNGLFSVTLDFSNQFPGAARWLEIGVRTNGNGTFTILSPRQTITATPYAITASSVTGPVSTSQLSGSLQLAQLPTILITNGASGVNISGAFIGNLTGNATTASSASTVANPPFVQNFLVPSTFGAGNGTFYLVGETGMTASEKDAYRLVPFNNRGSFFYTNVTLMVAMSGPITTSYTLSVRSAGSSLISCSVNSGRSSNTVSGSIAPLISPILISIQAVGTQAISVDAQSMAVTVIFQ